MTDNISMDDLFKKIINSISLKLSEEPKLKSIIDRVENFYVSTADLFRSSKECRAILTKTFDDISASRNNHPAVFKAIAELVEILKSHKKEKKRATTRLIAPAATTAVELIVLDDPFQVSNGACSNVGPETAAACSSTGINDAKIRRKQKLIKENELLLWKISKQIKKYGEREMDLDAEDDENSAFMILERLELKAYKVKQNINKLKNELLTCGRPCDKVLSFVGSGHECIDKAITKFINAPKRQPKKISSQFSFAINPPSSYKFPSRIDVDQIIAEQNNLANLNLSQTEMDKLACEVSEKVMKLLQARNHKDRQQMVDDWLVLQNQTDITDPANDDQSLKDKLSVNDAEAKKSAEALSAKNAQNGNYDEKEGDQQSDVCADDDDASADENEGSTAEEQPQQPDDYEDKDSLIEINDDSVVAEELPAISTKRKSPEIGSRLNENPVKKQKIDEEIIDISDSPTCDDIIEIPDDDED